MERKVTIVNNGTQTQKSFKINETVVTLGDLKKVLREKNIEFEGFAFNEGHARVELKDNNSVLPSNIPFKGAIVNDLVFLLTKPNKKISSGLNRAEVYRIIKERNLQEAIKSKYGKNFTVVSTENLLDFIGEGTPVSDAETKVQEEKKYYCGKEVQEGKKYYCEKAVKAPAANVFNSLMDLLIAKNIITEDEAAEVLAGGKVDNTAKISDEDLDDMFDFVVK